MEIACMDAERIVGYFRGKSILITGSTGFLGKILVEKILRVQPDANKLCLLVRGTGRHLLLVVVKQVHHIMHDVLLHSFCACNAMQCR